MTLPISRPSNPVLGNVYADGLQTFVVIYAHLACVARIEPKDLVDFGTISFDDTWPLQLYSKNIAVPLARLTQRAVLGRGECQVDAPMRRRLTL